MEDAMDMRRRNFLWGSAVVIGGGALGLAGAEVLSPVTSLAAESGDPSGVFPNVVLTSHEGTSHRFYDDLIKGKKVVINLFYAGCGDVCPLVHPETGGGSADAERACRPGHAHVLDHPAAGTRECPA
jgi:hypothetical protein